MQFWAFDAEGPGIYCSTVSVALLPYPSPRIILCHGGLPPRSRTANLPWKSLQQWPMAARGSGQRLMALLGLPPRRNAGYVTCAQAADKTKRRKYGSSVAYKTIGTFLSKVKRKDASGLATEQTKTMGTQQNTLSRRHAGPTGSLFMSYTECPPPPGYVTPGRWVDPSTLINPRTTGALVMLQIQRLSVRAPALWPLPQGPGHCAPFSPSRSCLAVPASCSCGSHRRMGCTVLSCLPPLQRGRAAHDAALPPIPGGVSGPSHCVRPVCSACASRSLCSWTWVPAMNATLVWWWWSGVSGRRLSTGCPASRAAWLPRRLCNASGIGHGATA